MMFKLPVVERLPVKLKEAKVVCPETVKVLAVKVPIPKLEPPL